MDQYSHPVPADITTRVLLVEADPDTREHHRATLSGAGYDVASIAALPSPDQLTTADLIIVDESAFDWLSVQQLQHEPNIVVLTDDVKRGVEACLCGAVDWIPARADKDYLVGAVKQACNEAQTLNPWRR